MAELIIQEPKALEPKRTAALLILMARAMAFKEDSLAGCTGDQEKRAQAIASSIRSAALKAIADSGPKTIRQRIDEAIARCDLDCSGDVHESTTARVQQFRSALAGADCNRCNGAASDPHVCLAEFTGLLESVGAFLAEKLRPFFSAAGAVWPDVRFGVGFHHSDDEIDILEITAISGSCRYDDTPARRVSVVKLGIKDDALDWKSLCQAPYTIMHELVCHALQGITGAERRLNADPSCAWSEGWMDYIAYQLTKAWLWQGDLPNWLKDSRDAVEVHISALHERRYMKHSKLRADTVSARANGRRSAQRLRQHFGASDTHGNFAQRRLLEFSVRLNLENIAQVERARLVECLGRALEDFAGVRRDRMIGACSQFSMKGDYPAFVNSLKSLGILA